jgi:hypothetical protein
VPIDLRTEEHHWFQTSIRDVYQSRSRIELMEPADILNELIHNRPLRDAFFPNHSMATVMKVRQLAMGTESLTTEGKGELAVEHAHHFLEDWMDLEPRLRATVTIGQDPIRRQASTQHGLVMSFAEGEKTTHVFAREVETFNLDPIRFQIETSLPAGELKQITSSSALIRSFFEGKNPSHYELQVNPTLPPELG